MCVRWQKEERQGSMNWKKTENPQTEDADEVKG